MLSWSTRIRENEIFGSREIELRIGVKSKIDHVHNYFYRSLINNSNPDCDCSHPITKSSEE